MTLSKKGKVDDTTAKKNGGAKGVPEDYKRDTVWFLKDLLKGFTNSSIDGILKQVNQGLSRLELAQASAIIAFDSTRGTLLAVSLDISPGAVSLNIPIPERMLNTRAVETLIKEGCTFASPGRIDLRKVKRLFQLGFEGVGAGEELVEIAFGGLNRVPLSRKWIFVRKGIERSKGFYMFLLPSVDAEREGAGFVVEFIDLLSELLMNRIEMDRLNLELERHAAVIEAQGSPFFLLVDGRIEFFTSGLAELLGVVEENLWGSRLSRYLDSDDAEAFERAVEIYSEGSTESHVRRYYRVYRTADGLRELEVSLEPVMFKGRSAIRGTVRDRNKHREIEKMAFDGKHLESLVTLAGGVAHDFNNLLGAILGYTSLLRNSLKESTEELRYLDKIEEAGARAVKLSKQLLFISRKGKYVNEVVDLGEILSRISKSCSMPMGQVSVVKNLNARNTNVYGDPSQLYEAFLNICMNAKESMPGGGTVTIESDNVYLDHNSSILSPGMKDGEYLRIKISDAGSGMQPEILRRASDPFFTTKKREGKRGLGLPVAIGIIESHDGKLLMRSDPGIGTEVTVLLPVTYSSVTEDTSYEEEAYERFKVLVVDDEEIVCSLVSDMLTTLGIESIPVYSGREAIELVEREKIDLVILDLVMPEMNGREVFYRLKKSHSEIPVIVSSGYVDETIVHRLLSDGAISFLKKPYVLDDLKKAIRKAAGLRKAMREG